MKGKTSLVFFTILAQTGIGLAVAAQVLGAEGSLARAARLVALLLTAVGLGVAFSHLGRPFSAFRAIFNLKTSWLSRECLFLGAFLGVGCGMVYLEQSGGTATGLGWLLVLVGILSLASMASLYGKTAIPAWQMLHTHIAFHTAAIALGALALAAMAAWTPIGANLAARAGLLAAGAVVVQLLGLIAYLRALGTGDAVAQASLHLLADLPLLGGLALTAIGGLGLPVLAYAALGSATVPLWLSLAVASLFAGQLLVRYSYYASGVHIMTAGWADIAYCPASRKAK